jgi:hypothetical protein
MMIFHQILSLKVPSCIQTWPHFFGRQRIHMLFIKLTPQATISEFSPELGCIKEYSQGIHLIVALANETSQLYLPLEKLLVWF